MAQVTSITSETLQAKIRELLPSQQGFGEDLQASNVILPVIDLTATAEGAGVPSYLQTALAFGSQTAFSQVGSGTTVIANSPGFYRIFASANMDTANTNHTVALEMSDGLSTKTIWEMGNLPNTSTGTSFSVNIDVNVFLASGESVSAVCNAASYTALVGSVRQIATVNGTLVNPSGFSPQ